MILKLVRATNVNIDPRLICDDRRAVNIDNLLMFDESPSVHFDNYRFDLLSVRAPNVNIDSRLICGDTVVALPTNFSFICILLPTLSRRL